MKARVSLLLTALALAGCSAVGPDYKLPDAAAAKRPAAVAPFAEASGSQAYRQDALPEKWWSLYQEPVLDGLVAQALAANADLRVAAANLDRMQAVTREVQAQQQPAIAVNAAPGFGHVSGIQEFQPNVVPPNHWSYSMTAGVSYQLDLAGQIRRAIEAASRDAEAAQATYDVVRITVAAETAGAYADMCAAGMQLASAQQSVKLQRASLEAVQRLQNAGRSTLLDVSRARSQLAQLQASLPPFQARQHIALYRLAALTGRLPNEMPAALMACIMPPRLMQAIPVGDGAALLKRRPDIRQAERALAAATARIGVAMADLYPKISLGLSGGSAGPGAMFADRGTFSWSLGPLISWTVPNSGAAQARIAQAQAGNKAAFARFDAAVLNALSETESALASYARELDRNAILKTARDQSAQAADQARTLFEYGKTDYLTTLDADRTLADTQSALAASQAKLSADQIKLFLALGGGWGEGE